MPRDTCIDRLCTRARIYPNENAYFTRKKNRWESISWEDYHEQVRRVGKALIYLGLKEQDKVSILGFNCLEWVSSAMGAQYIGCVSVGIYSTSSVLEICHVVSHSDSKILVVENLQCYEKQVKPVRHEFHNISHIVLMSNELSSDKNVLGFKEFLNHGDGISDKELDKRRAKVDSASVATMIYTSGTTGNPKSVMLSHESVAWTVRKSVKAWNCGPADRAISYLPLAHVAEQFFSIYAPIDCGMHSYFATSFENLKQNIIEVEPTIFFGVPRVFEKIYAGVKDALDKKTPILKKIISHFSKITYSYHEINHQGNKPDLWTKAQYLIAQKSIFAKLRKKIGLAKARLCMSGAAPLSKEILDFFCGLDIPIYEIYGTSECSGPATFNVKTSTKLGTVGHSIPGGKIKIAKDGEVLIQGPHVFLGYYKDQDATSEVLKDGWLYTGDIGSIDADGFLKITDRKKDILITAGGKNISPQNIESMLKKLPFVQSAVVVGDAKKYLAALLSPDIERIAIKAAQLGIDQDKCMTLINNPIIHEEIKAELDKLNNTLAPVEQIKRYSLLSKEFSIDSGEFTPTMKVKRKFVNQKYQDEINNLYN